MVRVAASLIESVTGGATNVFLLYALTPNFFYYDE